MANVLVFNATQDNFNVNACRYALLKYLESYNLTPPATTKVVVYTERPAFFELFFPYLKQFTIKEISQAQLSQPGTYQNAAVKNLIIKESMPPVASNVLYLGAAFYPCQRLETLFAEIEKGRIFLEALKPDEKKAVLKKTVRQAQASLPVPAPENLYGSGVVGLNAAHAPLLSKAFDLMQNTTSPLPENVVEAVAYSTIMNEAAALATPQNEIGTFKNFSNAPALLNAFFKKNEEESIPNQVKHLHYLNLAKIQLEKAQYQELPFYKRWLLQFTGKGWSRKQYEKKF